MTREEAIKLIDTHTVCFYNEIDSPTLQALHLAIEALSKDRPTGKWVIHDEVKNIYGGIYIECSECGTKFVTQTLEDEHFCRNCGADMR